MLSRRWRNNSGVNKIGTDKNPSGYMLKRTINCGLIGDKSLLKRPIIAPRKINAKPFYLNSLALDYEKIAVIYMQIGVSRRWSERYMGNLHGLPLAI